MKCCLQLPTSSNRNLRQVKPAVSMFISTVRSTLLLATTSLLIACASPAIKPNTSNDAINLNAQHLNSLKSISSFEVQGRIGIQTNPKGFSGSLVWQHGANSDDIALFSPLGSQLASIKRSSSAITLTDGNGNSYSAIDAETLTRDVLGWQLPLTGLSDWVLGRPSAAPIARSIWNAQGQLTHLEQDGWNIEYDNYQQQGAYILPGKIYLKSEQLNLKLLIEKWHSPAQ